ncbi:MAG: hypothetical protein HC919_13910 [Oscillatoriales cyanobacterium SM2_2_1]|nr:hypothetical protein [Oscillatoriales cyanobacterium SM2_2_1]
MSHDIDKILAEFGYAFRSDRLVLPHTSRDISPLLQLKQEIEANLKLTILSSEISRREAVIAPILFAVARFCHCQIRLEYSLNVNDWLKGNLDYLLISDQTFLVVEAKKDDLAKGFTQLATELIAISEAEGKNLLYGAVTIGDAWRFGVLDATQKLIVQDIGLIPIPDRLEDLFQILVGILLDNPEDVTL